MKQTAILFSLIVLMFSCKKKEDSDEPKTYANYSALSIGNYWVYDYNSYNENGTLDVSISAYDSICINGDTVVNGNRYFKRSRFENNYFIGASYLRDSMHYIVSLNGGIVFSSEDFGRVFRSDYLVFGNDTFCRREFSMQNKNGVTNVPAGTFTTHSLQNKLYLFPNYAKTNPIRNVEYKYAAGIGLVYFTEISTSSTYAYFDYKLSRYKVK